MLDDAAFYAANGLVSDRFLLTTAFNLHFTKPMRSGEARAEGRWISRQAPGFRRRGANRRFRRRGMRARYRDLHALAHRAVQPRRLSRGLMSERLARASRSSGADPPGRGRRRLWDNHQTRGCGSRRPDPADCSAGRHQACLERALGAMETIAGKRSGHAADADDQSLADWSQKRRRLMKIYG